MRRTVLVYGGNGALGRSVVSLLNNNSNKRVISVDFIGSRPACDEYIPLDPTKSPQDHARFILQNVTDKVDAVVHTAGGWNHGHVLSDQFIDLSENMWRMNTASALNAAHIAAKLLNPSGILVFTGALVAQHPCSSMLSYSISKAAVHYLTKSLSSTECKDFPKDCKIAAILPVTIDTLSNRQAMPNSDYSSWTPTDTIAQKIQEWIENPDSLNHGGLYSVITENHKTQFSQLS